MIISNSKVTSRECNYLVQLCLILPVVFELVVMASGTELVVNILHGKLSFYVKKQVYVYGMSNICIKLDNSFKVIHIFVTLLRLIQVTGVV